MLIFFFEIWSILEFVLKSGSKLKMYKIYFLKKERFFYFFALLSRDCFTKKEQLSVFFSTFCLAYFIRNPRTRNNDTYIRSSIPTINEFTCKSNHTCWLYNFMYFLFINKLSGVDDIYEFQNISLIFQDFFFLLFLHGNSV